MWTRGRRDNVCARTMCARYCGARAFIQARVCCLCRRVSRFWHLRPTLRRASACCAINVEPTARPSSVELRHPLASIPTAMKRTHDDNETVHGALKRLFGMDKFKPGQQQVVQALLEGRNAAAIFPTGGGKSLCLQLPALMLNDGLTLVISPLIALMKDQVDALRQRRWHFQPQQLRPMRG